MHSAQLGGYDQGAIGPAPAQVMDPGWEADDLPGGPSLGRHRPDVDLGSVVAVLLAGHVLRRDQGDGPPVMGEREVVAGKCEVEESG